MISNTTMLRTTTKTLASRSSSSPIWRVHTRFPWSNSTNVYVTIRAKSAPVADAEFSMSTMSKNTLNNSTKAEADNSTSSIPIALSLLAAAAGIATVSLAAMVVEKMTASTVPRYNPAGQRFDQSHFAGRFSKMLLACDPRLLLYSQEQVRHSQQMLETFREYPATTGMDHELWESRRIVESALNENGEWIPRPFRMSGYVPYNGPICVAMIASQSTLPLLFWSWINQSQNALINYYNRNSSSTLTNETLIKSYVAAVCSALAVAFGLATFIQRRYNPEVAKQLLQYVAFPSSVAASSLNCYIVRSPEIDTGIPLLDEDGEPVLDGTTSNIAAAKGVYLTTASRAILQAPVFFVPPVALSLIPMARRYLLKNPTMTAPVSTFLLLVSFGCGLPATVAIFPQISSIKASDAEEKFQNLRNPKTNQPYEIFYFNKGL